MDIRHLVGRNVRKLRLANGLTQEEFAARSGFSQQYISDLENGRRNPTIVSILELAVALGVPHTDLVAPDAAFHGEKRRRNPAPVNARRRK
jgi:transcriptional regulator with XRE-family HTH domain